MAVNRSDKPIKPQSYFDAYKALQEADTPNLMQQAISRAKEKATQDFNKKLDEIEAREGPVEIVRREMVPTENGYSFKYWYRRK